MGKVVIMDHPLIQHKIGILRRKETGSKDFRTLISEISMLMCYEATRDLKLKDVENMKLNIRMRAQDFLLIDAEENARSEALMNPKPDNFSSGFLTFLIE